jgi:rare lipoprotein A (peptidoglycan hydrolase)
MKVKDLLNEVQRLETNEGAMKNKIGAVAGAAMMTMHPGNYADARFDQSPPAQSQEMPQQQQHRHANAPFYKIGASYTIGGEQFHPQFDPHYKKTGVASWYGPGFHGRKTANGDIFDTNSMMAASPTLPLPSKVQVTNLENGKKVMVTVTDRGPYARGRLIDLSRKAAEELGYLHKGTAKVKVEYDPKATEEYLKQVGLYDQYLKANKLHDKTKDK